MMPAERRPTGSQSPVAVPRGRVLLVIGMPGAGRSTAPKTLDDIGYEGFDNLPLAPVPALFESAAADALATAVGADVRTRAFAIGSMLGTLNEVVGRTGCKLLVIFVDCDDELLEGRYTETCRPRPFAGDRPIIDGIRLERGMVASMRGPADLTTDTSDLNAGELKRLLTGHFSQKTTGVQVFITSLAYWNGLPRNADLVFDVRFLDNPHYLPELRALSGRDLAVATHIEQDPGFLPFFPRLLPLLQPLLPLYEEGGKPYLTIGIGCTGGRHRSVYVVEQLITELRIAGWRVELSHRDLVTPLPPAPIQASAPVLAS
jgi:RNase adapter protein RapZ